MSEYEIKSGRGPLGKTAPAGKTRDDHNHDAVNSVSDQVSCEPSFEAADAAELQRYASGFDLIPLHSPSATRTARSGPRIKLGKVPKDKRWTSSSYNLDAMTAHMRDGENVGVNLASGDWLVIDVDPRNFEVDEDDFGENSFDKLVADFGLEDEWLKWPCVNTGGGGFHYYLRKPKDVKIVGELRGYPGVEFKAEGRQVVAAGSVHPESGKVYRWDSDRSNQLIVDAPKALLAKLAKKGASVEVATSSDNGIFDCELVERLLATLDPEDFCDFDDWLELAMACHHASGGYAMSEFIAWSTLDPVYSDHEDNIERHWTSFDTDKRDSKMRTYRSLLWAVENHGGEGKEEALETARHSVRHFKASADFEDEVLDWTQPVAPKGPETSIQEQKRMLTELNKEFFTVLRSGGYSVGRERLDRMFGHRKTEFFSDIAIRKHLDRYSIRVQKDGDVKRVPMGKWYLHHPDRRHYEDIIFDPKPDTTYDHEYNLWSGWSVEPAAGDWEPFRRLILDVLCSGNEEAYEYVLNWCARMVQMPHLPGEVVLVFLGAKRAGKGTFGRALVQLATPHGAHVIQKAHLTGKFNAHLAMKVALFADEAFFTGDPQQAATLKGMATEESFMAEPKGIDAFSVPNMLHIVMASNSDWVVSADEQEQRFAVFQVKKETADKFKQEGGFKELFDERSKIKKSILAAFLHDMLLRDVQGWRPQEHIPETEGLIDQRLETLLQEPRVRWWYRCLAQVATEEVASEWRTEELIVGPPRKQDFYSLYTVMLDELPFSKKRYKMESLAKWLRATFCYDFSARDDKNRRAWRLPPLDVCRADFERVFQVGAIDWEEAEAEYVWDEPVA